MTARIRTFVLIGAVVGAIAATGLLWTVAASWLFVWMGGLFSAFPEPRVTWWLYALSSPSDRWTKLYLAVSGVLAAAPITFTGVFVGCAIRPARKLRRSLSREVRPSERGVTDNHGHADWLQVKAMMALFPGPRQAYGGVVVGEAYRVDRDPASRVRFEPRDKTTWGDGGCAPLLVDPCMDGPTHSLIFAGSGGFKTTSAVTTILHWTGSSVILDPSCETGPMLAAALSAKGKTVALLDPDQPGPGKPQGFNALDWIDTSHPLAEMHVHTVVSWIFSENPGRKNDDELFFIKWGKDLVACLMADLLWDDQTDRSKTLREVRARVVTPEKAMRTLLKTVHQGSKSAMARDLAGALMGLVAETFSGIYANANQGTSWLSVRSFADLVSGDGFRTRDITNGKLSVFVQVPLAALMTAPGVGRVIIGALLNAAYHANGDVSGRILFLLDEVARLGKMAILETARDVGRKYGITLQLCYQSVGQLEGQWGKDGKRAWYDGVSWRGYAAIQDMETAKEVSAACGNRAVLAYSEGDNRGRQTNFGFGSGSRSRGSNTNVHEIRRALITPDELVQDARTDEMFVLARSSPPIRCGRAIYFRRKELTDLVSQNRFAEAAAQ
jgi:type IV secretion system protein VirD4